MAGACDTASFGPTFNDTLYIDRWPRSLVCGAPPAAALTTVRDAQQANGGWNFLGDPTGTDLDIDTTALAVEALVAGGADATDPAVRARAGLLRRQPAGERGLAVVRQPTTRTPPRWRSSASPPQASTWSRRAGATPPRPPQAGTAYASPTAWLGSQQLASPANDLGRIASPNDGFGVNTFATSQSVEGLLQSWLPDRARARAVVCAPADADRRHHDAGRRWPDHGDGRWLHAVDRADRRAAQHAGRARDHDHRHLRQLLGDRGHPGRHAAGCATSSW